MGHTLSFGPNYGEIMNNPKERERREFGKRFQNSKALNKS